MKFWKRWRKRERTVFTGTHNDSLFWLSDGKLFVIRNMKAVEIRHDFRVDGETTEYRFTGYGSITPVPISNLFELRKEVGL